MRFADLDLSLARKIISSVAIGFVLACGGSKSSDQTGGDAGASLDDAGSGYTDAGSKYTDAGVSSPECDAMCSKADNSCSPDTCPTACNILQKMAAQGCSAEINSYISCFTKNSSFSCIEDGNGSVTMKLNDCAMSASQMSLCVGQACDNCIKSNCASENSKLEKNCLTYLNCYSLCNGQNASKSCFDACNQSSPDCFQANADLHKCRTTVCSEKCVLF